MAGVNFGGLFNYSGKELQGIQFAGLANIGREDIQGIQFSGAINWSGENAQGLQFAGVANYAANDMQGLYFGGAANISNGSMQGLIFSGIFNYSARETQGIVASGGLNYSEEMQGLQIGLVNYAKHMQGAPVGLISYYGNGRRNIDFWTSDAGFSNIGVKLGTEEVYNMISIGFNPALSRDVWQLGWGIGRLHTYRNHYLHTDFSIFKINEGEWTKDLNMLYKYRLLFGKEITTGLNLYGGPTFNMLVTRVPESSNYTWYRLFDFGAKGRDYIFWIGYSFGIELF